MADPFNSLVNMTNIKSPTVSYPIFSYLLLLVTAFGENQYCTHTVVLPEHKNTNYFSWCTKMLDLPNWSFAEWIRGRKRILQFSAVRLLYFRIGYWEKRIHRRIAWGFSTFLIMHLWTTLHIFILCSPESWETKISLVLKMFLSWVLRGVRRKLFIC